jgi:hypothetical protein
MICADIEGPKWGERMQALGSAGPGKVEEAIIASLVTGEPILMIRRHRTAKTAMSREIAKMLGLRSHACDASKSVFEDVIGFPNPQSIRDGQSTTRHPDLDVGQGVRAG